MKLPEEWALEPIWGLKRKLFSGKGKKWNEGAARELEPVHSFNFRKLTICFNAFDCSLSSTFKDPWFVRTNTISPQLRESRDNQHYHNQIMKSFLLATIRSLSE